MSPNPGKRHDRRQDRRTREGYTRKPRRKVCFFCKEKIDYIDYKDVNLLKRYVSDKGKIRPRRVTGNCSQHQKKLATAVKNAREMALIPYTARQGEVK